MFSKEQIDTVLKETWNESKLEPREYQFRICTKALEGFLITGYKSILVESPVGCHAKGTKVLLADGKSIAVENITIGTKLLGRDSKIRTVHTLYNGNDIMYKVIPVKGTPFVVNQHHILTLCHTSENTLLDVSVEEYIHWSNWKKSEYKLIRSEGVEFEEKSTTIEPYFLGLLLGDGCITVQPGITSIDEEIIFEAYKYAAIYQMDIRKNDISYYFNKNNNETNTLTLALRELNLMGTNSGNKFIPDIYKYNSKKVRLEILAGLLDTDGSLGTNCFDYISKSEQLADDVIYICRSLGLAAHKKECIKGCQTGAKGTYYRTTISGHTDIIPTRLKRKQATPRKQKKNVLKTGFSLECLGEGEYFGFGIDGDHRYLLDDFTITHNSGKTSMALIICKSMQKLLNTEETDLPIGWISHRRELLDQANNENRVKNIYADIEFVSMFEKSPPTGLRMLVVDESHRDACSSSAHIHNTVKPEYILGITGTPFRTDKVKLCFDKTLKDAGIGSLIKLGYLSPYHHFTIDKYSPKEVSKIYLRDKKVWGKTIIFFHRVESCNQAAEILTNAGIRVQVVTGSSDRDRQLQSFKDGELDVILNCNILTEGFDMPELQTVFARPSIRGCTIQMCGRALRKHPNIPWKNIVQSKDTKWPFPRTAMPLKQHMWEAGGGHMGGKWSSLTPNDNADVGSQSVVSYLAMAPEVVLPKFLTSQKKGKKRIV